MVFVSPFSYEGLRYYILSIAKSFVFVKAFFTRKAFYCSALGGESSYNIVINSDLTVSCNCTDYYGQGQLGNLKTNSFSEIFFGSKANNLRNKLAKGKIPLWICVLCIDRKTVSRKDALQLAQKKVLPSNGMMVENTISCNLNCISCPRSSLKKLRSSTFMKLPDTEIVAQTIKNLNLKAVAYFNLGEPFISNTIYQELQLLKKVNPETDFVLSTNGQLVDNDEKREAAMLLKGICFSVHGSDNQNLQKYQRNANFDKAYKNICDMVAYRDSKGAKFPQIEWKYVLFRWNDKPEHIELAIELAKKANVDLITFWPTFSPPYAVSLRYLMGKFDNIGTKNGKVREIRLRSY